MMTNPAADTTFAKAFQDLRTSPGAILFTALQWIPERSALRRVFTSHPLEYPLGAEKTVEISPGWLGTVIEDKEPFLAADLAALRNVFTDSDLIQSLGCGAVINVPVMEEARLVGVLALLDAEGRYTPASVPAAAAVVEANRAALAEAFAAYPADVPRKDTVTP